MSRCSVMFYLLLVSAGPVPLVHADEVLEEIVVTAGFRESELMKIADQRPGLSISAFVETVLASLASPETPRKQASPKMNLQQVEQLVRDLEATFKDPEAFASVFETLKSTAVRREEAVEHALGVVEVRDAEDADARPAVRPVHHLVDIERVAPEPVS